MSVYLLSYDLVEEKKNAKVDYERLWTELKRLGAHRTQRSVWLINLNNTPSDVLDHFKGFVDHNDRIWVTKVFKGEYTFVNAMKGTNDWIAANPPETR
jgi:CRISPR/Cas system-associated endoribonuclease Cas2